MQFNARLFFGISAAISAVMLIIVGASWLTPRSTPDTLMAQGYAVWQANGCSGCHTLYGLGGVYAPDLTHIYAQRGDTYLREFLANPNAFHPDQRIMPRFHLNRTETDALIAFLASTSSAEAVSAFPPRPIAVSGMGGLGGSILSAQAAPSEALSAVEAGRALFSRAPAICSTCHSLEPDVVIVGPSLYGIADTAWYRQPGTSPEEYIRASILAPSDYVVEGFQDVMQKNFGDVLSAEEVNNLIAFLMTLEEADGS